MGAPSSCFWEGVKWIKPKQYYLVYCVFWRRIILVFRGAPSGYFGESSAGTFNPSWYLNDLGTMYKRVTFLILPDVSKTQLTFPGTLLKPIIIQEPSFTSDLFQGPSFIPAYSTERCVGNGSPCLYRAGLVRPQCLVGRTEIREEERIYRKHDINHDIKKQ